MRKSLRGHDLPESEQEYVQLREQGKLKFPTCIKCGKDHAGRTDTPLGWAETQISGLDERCFEQITRPDDDQLPAS
jgi:hypothetical protein